MLARPTTNHSLWAVPMGCRVIAHLSNTGVAWYLNGVSSWGLFFSQDWLLKLLLSKAKLQVSTLVCLPCAWKKTKFMFVVFQIDVFGSFLNIGAAHRWTAHRGQSIGGSPSGMGSPIVQGGPNGATALLILAKAGTPYFS